MTPRQLVESWVDAFNRAADMTCMVENLSFLRMHGLPLPQS